MRIYQESLGLTESAFVILRDLIHEKTGIFFENGKKDILADKLSSRVIDLGYNSFLDYYYRLKYDESADEEWQKLMNLITVNETYFGRESAHINLLVNYIVPNFFKNNTSKPLRIWSSACSTGEEPLSIVIALNEAGYLKELPIEIYASDGSSSAIYKAQQGLYRERAFRSYPNELREKYFTKEGDHWRVSQNILSKVVWSVKNLVDLESISLLAYSSVIFCRNVFIYFSEEQILRIVNHFYEKMMSPGYLFVGVTESLLRYDTKFDLQEINDTFVYVKNETNKEPELGDEIVLNQKLKPKVWSKE